MITIKYILPADDLHRLALKRRFQLSICRLLTSAALGFIAEIDIKNYTEKFVPTPTIECKVLTDVLKRDQWSRAEADTNSVKILTAATSDIIVESLAKSSSRAPRNHHRGESSHQASQHHRREPREIFIASPPKSSLRIKVDC
jgi:hypothetical protein